MATKFVPWIDDDKTAANTFDAEQFATGALNVAQRANGLQPGTVASAKVVNSALRQANLVAAALMSICDDAGTTDLQSTVASVASKIASKFNSFGKVKSQSISGNTYSISVFEGQQFAIVDCAPAYEVNPDTMLPIKSDFIKIHDTKLLLGGLNQFVKFSSGIFTKSGVDTHLYERVVTLTITSRSNNVWTIKQTMQEIDYNTNTITDHTNVPGFTGLRMCTFFS